MLDFFLNYPLAHYLKSLTRSGNPPKIGMYLSRDTSMMLLRKGSDRPYWNGALRETQGSPGLDIFVEKEKAGMIASAYRQEVYKKIGINKNNELHVLVDDPETYTSTYTVTSFETAEDLAEALDRDPAGIITTWKNYTENNEYIWEILSPEMKILRGTARLPKKVLLCGIPAEKAHAAAKWAAGQGQTLTNLIPATVGILQWAKQEGPQTGFFLVTQTDNEVAIAQFEKGAIKTLLNLRTKDGITADEINDLNEMTEEAGGRDSTIWCWGILPGSNPHGRLTSRYKNLRTITPENLRDTNPIDLADKTERIQNKEAWLLDFVLR